MSRPLEEYLNESKDGHISEENAKEWLTSLVNDQELIKEACAIFLEAKNVDVTCYAVGKLYDVKDESYACITMMSQDVHNIIGQEYMQETQEKLNLMLLSSFIEFKRLCKRELDGLQETWDSYISYMLQSHFLPLYENGIRVSLVHNDSVRTSSLPVVVFAIYEKYEEVYG